MQHLKSPRPAQRFLFTHSFIYGHFRQQRHLMPSRNYRMARAEAFRGWYEEMCVRKAA